MKKKIASIGKKLYWAVFNMRHERKFVSHGYPLHYLYQPGKSDTLIIVFSAFAPNLYPTYNYVRTLWGKTGCHLLFIKDDFIHLRSGGSYYLGKNGDLQGISAVCELIQTIRKRTGAARVIGVGSSKGGTAALLFGVKLHFDILILGACQYFIGSYMQEHKPECLALLTGNQTPSAQEIADLDCIVRHAVTDRRNDKKPLIHLHYSDKEHTYSEHIEPMLQDLEACGYTVVEDVGDYTRHTDVSIHFVPYLQRILLNTLQK